ncbi:alpha/beta fold hydrolase [Bordetella genomosp. 13]|uniref:alpha/beta fold hydrolase n=1 Tax=Bordetella genomosp. 13 TaxID=463040 RepID=UPI0011A87893|nr:alpha/beta fold hydrolase [Bordetella genomosp. 13]
MPDIYANGIRHAYTLRGDGPPLVLIAGMGGAASYWTPQLDPFAARRRVLTYDQRATGNTERVPVRDIAQLADDLLALLDALDIECADLVGHSTGGAIAQVIAARHPERVRSQVIFASVHRADAYRRRVWGLRKAILQHMGPEVYAQTTSLFFYPPEYVAGHDAALAEVERRAAQGEIPSPDLMASRIDAILDFDISSELGNVRAPTLVCCAEDDMLTPAYFSREIAQAISGADLVLWRSGGHAYSRSNPDAFNRLVLDFLDQQDR